MAQVKAKFSIDNGSVIAKEGDLIVAGENGNLTVDEFVSGMPEIFKIQSTGGRGGGGDGQNNVAKSNNTGLSQIHSGLSKLRAGG